MRPEFCGCVSRRTPRFSRGSRRGGWTAVLGDLQQPADDSKKIAYTRKLLNDWNGVPEGTDTSVESSELPENRTIPGRQLPQWMV